MASDQGERTMTVEGLATKAEVVLDPRLAEVWQLLWSQDGEAASTVPDELLAALLRLAYLQGYADASAEPEPGELYRELGIRDGLTATGSSRGARARRRSSGR
jgi:hypothetical protein